MKTRLPEIGSPNRADALMITFMGEAATAAGVISQSSRAAWNKPLDYNPNWIY
jgi:hypothetical protein